MNQEIKSTTENILLFLTLILICFVFGFIYTGLSHLANILGWIFVIITAGLFFFSGKNFVDQGAFHNTFWKTIFIVFLPLIYLTNDFLIDQIKWYSGYTGLAYYFLFTIGLIVKKIPKS